MGKACGGAGRIPEVPDLEAVEAFSVLIVVVMTVTIMLRNLVELCDQRMTTTWKNFNVLKLVHPYYINIRWLLKLFTK